MIIRNRLPGVQPFLRPAALTTRSASFVCRIMLAFVCHIGRMSAAQAASLPRGESRHAAAIGRFLGRQRWAVGDWMSPLRAAMLLRAAKRLPAGSSTTLDVDLPADLARFRLPEAVAARLQALLNRQESGQPLTAQERDEAEGLVNLSEFLTPLRLRAERLIPSQSRS